MPESTSKSRAESETRYGKECFTLPTVIDESRWP